jgi:hypothetical protein
MSTWDISPRAIATARNFARAQEAWDNASPPEWDNEAREEKAIEAAEYEILRTPGVLADELAHLARGDWYDAVDVEALCRPEFAADDKTLPQLLAVMAAGNAESARRALLAFRLKLPALLKDAIDTKAAELLAMEPEYDEC